MIKNSSVIVTGGAGFIGSNLVKALLKNNNTVAVIDNLLTGKMTNLSGCDIKFIKGSVTNLSFLKKQFKEAEYVFHCAALPSVNRSLKNPIRTNHINAVGTLNVLVAAKQCGVKKVIYASSSAIYGDTPTLPKIESMVPNPKSPYAVSKLIGEEYCRLFSQLYGLETVSLRYFNVYGPFQNPYGEYAAVIPKFIMNALLGKNLIVYGDGFQTRDFTFVSDVVDATLRSAECTAKYTALNIAAGRSNSVNKLAKLILKYIPTDSKIIYSQPRPGDIRHSKASIEKARSLLNWKPKVELEKGLQATINYFKNYFLR